MFEALSRLRRFFQDDKALDSKTDYDHAVTVLDVSATQIAYAGVNVEVGAILLWPFFIPDSIVVGIKERRPHAMVILAHFAVLLHALDTTFWFLRNWARQLLADVDAQIGDRPRFKELLDWPKKNINV